MLYKSLLCASSIMGAWAQMSIIETAAATPSLSTLVAVVSDPDFAAVATALSGAGPFTVFAPNNDAFTAAGIDLAYAKANVADVTAVLQYHVHVGKIMSADIADGSQRISTLETTELNVIKTATGVTVNGADVVLADVNCTNGVVHVVDQVLMMPKTIVENAQATTVLSTLVTVLTTADYKPVLDLLSGAGPFTVFAPTDAAFTTAGIDVAFVTDPANIAAVVDILKYHVVQGAAVYSVDIPAEGTSPTTVQGSAVDVMPTADGVMVNDAKVTVANVQSSNGVVHVIDKVLSIPADVTTAAPVLPGSASVAAISTAALAAVALAL